MKWLDDTIRGHETPLAQTTGVWSCDLSSLAGDAGCHQLYKPPGHSTGGLFLFGHSGEHTLALAVLHLLAAAPSLGG